MLEEQSKNNHYVKFILNKQYVSVKKIGSSGFGTVWQVYNLSLKNYAACKELLPQFSNLKFVEMFYKEALIAKNILHANVIGVQHFWNGDNGSFYILMDYVNGIDLENLIKRCNEHQVKLPCEFSVIVCINILRVLDYINRVATDPITNKPYGIVYRDISPGNILISFDGSIKLSDFGIAKTVDDFNASLKQSVVTGKYSYISPEQIKGSKDIDHRSDIFSTAVILYEMITGKQLFFGDVSEIKSHILNYEFDKKILNDLDLPVEIGEILSKALKIDKTKRYDRAIEMYRDLRRVLKGVDEEEYIIPDFSSFILKVMAKEFNDSVAVSNFVKTIDANAVNNDSSVVKVSVSDFIVGQTGIGTVPVNVSHLDSEENSYKSNKSSEFQAAFEPKRKTIFEEVDDWFRLKMDNIRVILIRISISILIGLLIFLVCDTCFKITPLGEYICNKINPSNVILTTIPQDAIVSVKTKDGEIITENKSSRKPIALRNIQPGSYVVTASKLGFLPIERVVTVEKGPSKGIEKIDLVFDVGVKVESDPKNASVFVDGKMIGVTPQTVRLAADGAHTLKLMILGFSPLGSDIKEFKDGQCNIDLTKLDQKEIFSDVDRNFWDISSVQEPEQDQNFAMVGHLYKKIIFDTNPKNMVLQMYGESKPKGVTPVILKLKNGEHKIKFLDPNGKYFGVEKNIRVSSMTQEQIVVGMNKSFVFNVKTKELMSPFKVNLKIEPKTYIVSYSNNLRLSAKDRLLENNTNNQYANITSTFSSSVNNISEHKSVKITSNSVNISTTNIQDKSQKDNLTTTNASAEELNLKSSSTTTLGTVKKIEKINDLEDSKYDVQVITANKPFTMNLHIDTYKFTFFADGFEPFVKDNVDIEKIDSINVELSPIKVPFKFKVSYINNKKQRSPVKEATIWLDNTLVGKTNNAGKSEHNVAVGKIVKIKVVASGFTTKSFNTSAKVGSENIKKITLIPCVRSTVNKNGRTLKIKVTASSVKNEPKVIDQNKNKSLENKEVRKVSSTNSKDRRIVCSYCGYVNIIPKGRRLRFCLNCAKPLKY